MYEYSIPFTQSMSSMRAHDSIHLRNASKTIFANQIIELQRSLASPNESQTSYKHFAPQSSKQHYNEVKDGSPFPTMMTHTTTY